MTVTATSATGGEAASPPVPGDASNKPTRIGLLFVHGIGEQERFAHLRDSALELAELLRNSGDTGEHIRVLVDDRTAGWALAPGETDPAGLVPVTLTLKSETRHLVFECHEVWWADLGARAGLADLVSFWLWGLGQWASPIYRDMDASDLKKEDLGGNRPVSRLVKLPTSVAGKPRLEVQTRLQLLAAALAAIFVTLTWALGKRLLAAILAKAPSPTLIVRYVGDVRTYEERATPGDSAFSDPGYPRRVGIRRRMVTEMVAMAERDFQRWYVVAHSLGTVVAYNGLTEIGHTLPNYLPEKQWKRLKCSNPQFITDPDCMTREDGVHAMMPARPIWLEDADVLNRKLLFQNLHGFLTYGSPLDKFAALWPRIVATATDRRLFTDPAKPGEILFNSAFHKDCSWINLAAPHDPVSGRLDSFSAAEAEAVAQAVSPATNTQGAFLKGYIPGVVNYSTPFGLDYIVAHLRYFAGFEAGGQAPSTRPKIAVARWLMGEAPPDAECDTRLSRFRHALLILAPYTLAVIALWLLASVAIAMALDLGAGTKAGPLARLWAAAGPFLSVAFGAVATIGLLRWRDESARNVQSLTAELKGADTDWKPTKQERQQIMEKARSGTISELEYKWLLRRMLKRQRMWAKYLLVVFGPLIFFGLWFDLGLPFCVFGCRPGVALQSGLAGMAMAALAILASAIVQARVNTRVPAAKPASMTSTPTRMDIP